MYSAFIRTKESDFTLKAAQEANRYLRARIAQLITELAGDTGTLEQRKNDKEERRGGGEESSWGLVCLHWNVNLRCQTTPCDFKHECNQKVGKGKICGKPHRGMHHT